MRVHLFEKGVLYMKLQPKDKKQLLKAALGEIPSDLLIKHVQLVNVITGEIYPANVFV